MRASGDIHIREAKKQWRSAVGISGNMRDCRVLRWMEESSHHLMSMIFFGITLSHGSSVMQDFLYPTQLGIIQGRVLRTNPATSEKKRLCSQGNSGRN